MFKKLLKMSLASFMISGCTTVATNHPELITPLQPDLPKFTRQMVDCGHHNPATLALCVQIKRREAVLLDHIETVEQLIGVHNNELKTH